MKNHLQTNLRCHQVSINHENLAALNLDKLIVDSFLSDKRRVSIEASCARADVSSHKEERVILVTNWPCDME